jgi:hypothetical protein
MHQDMLAVQEALAVEVAVQEILKAVQVEMEFYIFIIKEKI